MTTPPAPKRSGSLLVLRLALAAVFLFLMVLVPWGVTRWAIGGQSLHSIPLPSSATRSADQ